MPEEKRRKDNTMSHAFDADDDRFLILVAQQPDVPVPVKNGLSGLY
jgi:hypothetical protein